MITHSNEPLGPRGGLRSQAGTVVEILCDTTFCVTPPTIGSDHRPPHPAAETAARRQGSRHAAPRSARACQWARMAVK